MTWLKDRLKEKASHGGLGLVAVGLIILFLGSWINIGGPGPVLSWYTSLFTRG